jgi:hypothetical protein
MDVKFKRLDFALAFGQFGFKNPFFLKTHLVLFWDNFFAFLLALWETHKMIFWDTETF